MCALLEHCNYKYTVMVKSRHMAVCRAAEESSVPHLEYIEENII